ncbi:MAG: Ig-like domain-containing protein [Lachnospira sp.]|nr:Ig-like domain-containing protein [Lachnospira sp.]
MKKSRIKPLYIAAAAVIVVILTAVAVLISFTSSKNDSSKTAQVSLDKANLKADGQLEQPSQKEKTQVDILFDNKAIAVGTSLKVTAIVTPDDNDRAIVWTSSNEAVFTVDKDGIITIVGEGVATLTATVGSVSDAVVIEGIRSIADGSDNGFSVYIPSSGNTYSESNNSGAGTGSGTGGGSANGGSTGGNSTGGGSTVGSLSEGSSTGGGSTGGSSTGGSSTGGGSIGGDSAGSSSSEGSSTGGGSTVGSSSEGSSTGVGSTGAGSSGIGDAIVDNGFEQTLSNVYVCVDNGTYYGEIITQSNVTIIYIKQRSAEFDRRINNVLESLIPGNSSQVWNNYLSASTDRTFTVDGRKVRIVVAAGGGHSQIVIYN